MTKNQYCYKWYNIIGGLYKNALKRMNYIFIIYTAISAIVLPGMYANAIIEQRKSNIPKLIEVLNIYTFGSLYLYCACIIVAVITLSVASNYFLYKQKTVDVYHSLPVKRTHQLLANYFATTTILIVSQIISFGLVIIIANIFKQNIEINLIVLEFIRIAMITLIINSISFVCCVSANKIIDAIIFIVSTLLVAPAYIVLSNIFCSTFIYGYTDGIITSDTIQIILSSSPITKLLEIALANVSVVNIVNIKFIIVSTLIILGLLLLALFVYKNRKSEVAQSNNIKNFMYQIVIYLGSIGGSVFIMLIATSTRVTQSNMNTPLFIVISSLLCGVILFVLFSIFTGSIKINKKKIINIFIIMGISCSVLIICCQVAHWFGTFIPDVVNIEKVEILCENEYSNIIEAKYAENGMVFLYSADKAIQFTSQQEIENVRKLNEYVLENRDSVGDDIIDKTNLYTAFTIKYTTTNGKEIVRGYSAEFPKKISEYFINISDNQTYKKQLVPILYESYDRVDNFVIRDGFAQREQQLNLQENDIKKLYEAMASDLLNRTTQMERQRQGVVYATILVNYKNIELPLGVESVQQGAPRYSNVSFDVTEDSINTIKVLTELGYADYTKITYPDNIKAIVASIVPPGVVITSRESRDYLYRLFCSENYVEIVDADQIQQLSNVVRETVYNTEDIENIYVVAFVDKSIPKDEIYLTETPTRVYFVKENELPDFIKK